MQVDRGGDRPSQFLHIVWRALGWNRPKRLRREIVCVNVETQSYRTRDLPVPIEFSIILNRVLH